MIAKWISFIRRLFNRHDPVLSIYEQVIQDSPSGIIVVDAQQPDMPIIFVNATFERITGYLLHEVVGRNCRFLQGEDRDQSGLETIRNAIRQGESCVATIRNYRKDGTLFWNELRISPIRDAAGTVTHFLGIQNDVTARMETAIKLEQSEARYRQMFENNQAVKLIIDPVTGRIHDANSTAARFYGYSVEQLRGMHKHDINILPKAQIILEMQRAVTEERNFFEFRHQLASGEIRDVDVFSSPVDMPEGRFLYSIIVDVTGKRQGELRYRSLFEQSNDAVFILSMDGKHLEVNHRAADMLGYTHPEIMKLGYKDTVPPQERAHGDTIIARLLQGEKIPPYERYFRRKDGSLVLTEINAEIVWDAEGKPLHVQSIARDITERKQMEAALRESEARLKALYSAIPDLIFRNRLDGVYLDYHAPDKKLLLIPPEEFLGKPIQDVLPPGIGEEFLQAIQEVITTHKPREMGYELPLEDGMHHFETRLVPSGEDEALSIIRDVTQLWNTRHELETTKSRLEFSVDAARIAWWEVNIATGESLFDSRKFVMAGYDAEEFADITYQELSQFIHPDDVAAVMQATDDLIQGRKSLYQADYRFRCADGTWIWFHDRGELATTASGAPAVRGYSIDITDRKLAHEKDLQLVLERERMNLLVTFIQNAAHEFRTPLSIINSRAYLLARLDDAEARQIRLTDIQSQVAHITRLIDTLLLVVKLEHTETIADGEVDLKLLWESLCRETVSLNGHEPQLTSTIEPDLPHIRGQYDYLKEAFRQIVQNAYQFTPPEGSVSVQVEAQDDSVCVTIQDDGQGIAEEVMPRIFEMFWRQDEAHTTPGFGVGLSIARRIVDLHHGEITVESTSGQGTTVVITLPIR